MDDAARTHWHRPLLLLSNAALGHRDVAAFPVVAPFG
jgi:hypothetical protein